jgi:hypothetical protein
VTEVTSSCEPPLVPKKPRGKSGSRSGLAVTLYLSNDWLIYTKMCKCLGVSASSRLSALMKEDLAKLGGGTNKEVMNQQRISELEASVTEIISRGKKIESILMQKKVYFDIEKMVDSFGIDAETFGNLKAITRRLLEYKPHNSDRFNRDDVLLFSSMLRLAAQKTRLQTELRGLLLMDTEPSAEIQPTIINVEATGDVPTSNPISKIDPEIQAEPAVPSAPELPEETETKSQPEEEDEENLEDSEN